MRAALPCLILIGLAACAPTTNRTGEAFTANGELIAYSGGEGGAANACFRCHGLEGQGDGAGSPRLAGLDPGYLQKQLDDYAAGLRGDKVMGPIAGWLDNGDRRAVADYYAALPAPAPEVGSGPAPAIYAVGAPARGLPACAACHGAGGEGVGPANPAVAGQPASYILDQLARWKQAERRNDPQGVMKAAAIGLTDAEMRAIAAWLERQPAAPRPDTSAASLSAAEAAWAGLAASRGTRHPGR